MSFVSWKSIQSLLRYFTLNHQQQPHGGAISTTYEHSRLVPLKQLTVTFCDGQFINCFSFSFNCLPKKHSWLLSRLCAFQRMLPARQQEKPFKGNFCIETPMKGTSHWPDWEKWPVTDFTFLHFPRIFIALTSQCNFFDKRTECNAW